MLDKTESTMDDCQVRRLENVRKKLKHILFFLKDYLPLANCHSTDFITSSHWDNFLSQNMKDSLLSLSDIELKSLHTEQWDKDKLSKELQGQGTNWTDTSQSKVCDLWNFSCAYIDSAPKCGDQSDIYTEELRRYRPNWTHHNLESFLQEARRNTLKNSDVLSTYENLQSRLDITGMENKLMIKDFMNTKKCHEVDMMGAVCTSLSQCCNVDVIIDMGSGKGYLSTQLAFQHHQTVIGIDAQTINTTGATKRASVLSKQWNGLMRNVELRQEGKQRKLGKKSKKELKKKYQGQNVKTGNRESANDLKPKKTINAANPTSLEEISDEILGDMDSLFSGSYWLGGTDAELKTSDSDKLLINSSEKETPAQGDKMEVTDQVTYTVNDPDTGVGLLDVNEKSTYPCNKTTSTVSVEDCSKVNCSVVEVKRESKIGKKDSKDRRKDCVKEEVTMELNTEYQAETGKVEGKMEATSHTRSLATPQRHFPLTAYVNKDTDLLDIVRNTICDFQLQKSKSGETNLMLTGLHTCGGLGSSILQLFVSCNHAKVLCNVGCCYHLMEEEFVASPFGTGENTGEHGFPLSSYLRQHRVGLGRLARNFASQALSRAQPESELKCKQFPRMLLQAILKDVLGYTKNDWRGLRKLHEKSADMFDYVQSAFRKLKLPETDLVSRELVDQYCEKYKDQERKFSAFFQLKSALAPCIEAVVLLDRLCYLLEQDCVSDAMLVELFDPVTSPRCYGIIAFKQQS